MTDVHSDHTRQPAKTYAQFHCTLLIHASLQYVVSHCHLQLCAQIKACAEGSFLLVASRTYSPHKAWHKIFSRRSYNSLKKMFKEVLKEMLRFTES